MLQSLEIETKFFVKHCTNDESALFLIPIHSLEGDEYQPVYLVQYWF